MLLAVFIDTRYENTEKRSLHQTPKKQLQDINNVEDVLEGRTLSAFVMINTKLYQSYIYIYIYICIKVIRYIQTFQTHFFLKFIPRVDHHLANSHTNFPKNIMVRF
jgi:hypothetical protein